MKEKNALKSMLHYLGIIMICVCVCISRTGCTYVMKKNFGNRVTEGKNISGEQNITEGFEGVTPATDIPLNNEPVEKEKTETVEDKSQEKSETDTETEAEIEKELWGEFEGFINGGESAIVDEEVSLGYDDFEHTNCGKTYTFDELNYYLISSGDYPHNPNIYAYLLEKDEGNLLLLKYDGMDIYCEDDDSFVILVLSSKEDGVHITCDIGSWCRSEVEINSAGIIASSGSDGAGDHIADKGYLDGSGLYNKIYFVEECSSGWINSMFMYNTDVSFSTETCNHAYEVDLDADNIVALYTIGGQMYGTVEYSDTEAAAALMESAEKDGVIWVDATETDGLIADYEEKMGLSDAMNAGEPDWVLIKEAGSVE